jgi:hypothetical protein
VESLLKVVRGLHRTNSETLYVGLGLGLFKFPHFEENDARPTRHP